MFRLGSVSPEVCATAEPDGWWLRPASGVEADLGQRDTWPGATLASQSGMAAALQVETLLDMELMECRDQGVRIRWNRFGEALENGAPLPLRWSTPSPLLLAIDSTGQIGRADFQYSYSFRLGARDVEVERVGYFVRRRLTQQLFHLDADTYSLVEAMDQFSTMPAEQRKTAGWLTFATVKGCSQTVGAGLDAYLASNNVVVPSQIALEFHVHDDGSTSFAPKCPEVDEAEFRHAFLRNSDVPETYTIDGEEGTRTRVVLNDRQKQVLGRMKQMRRLRGPNAIEARRDPAQYFDGLLDAVEIEYGHRVIGIGEFKFVGTPSNPRESVGFFEGAPTSTPPNTVDHQEELKDEDRSQARPMEVVLQDPVTLDDVSIRLRGQHELNEARSRMAQALMLGDSSVRICEKDVAVSQEALTALSVPPVEQEVGGGQGNGGKKKFLLVYTNEEETRSADVEQAELAAFSTSPAENFGLPKALRSDVELKQHQTAGLRWLNRCDCLRPNRRGILLADDMGLGKTLQILVHLARQIECGALRVDRESSDSAGPWRPILIVAPLILIENETWQTEMRAFFANNGDVFSPVLSLHGANIDRMRKDGSKGKDIAVGAPLLDADELMQHRTVLTNYETIVNFQHSFAQLKDGRPLWSIIVTDEAQKYKVPNTKVSHAIKALTADFHIASTGTPVENRLLDLWNIMDALQPALLGTAKEFSADFERPLSNSDGGKALNVLRERIHLGKPQAFVLRRRKDEVLDLPEKSVVQLDCVMSDKECEAHADLLSVLRQERRAGRHLAVLHRLQALYQHPALLRGKGLQSTTETLKSESSKLRAVLAQLHTIRQRGEKAIIFARLLDMQQILAQVLQDEFGGRVNIINGATGRTESYAKSSAGTARARMSRQRILKDFRAQAGFSVLILSPHVAGIGLTITEANHVFHYGRWWNPAVESQATDRAYRIGQTRPVNVYLPILRDASGKITKTFDQALDELIRIKTDLAYDFLNPVDSEDVNAADLCDLLERDEPKILASAKEKPFTEADLGRMDPLDFEAAVAALYQADGYRVVLTAKSNDGGADVLAVGPNDRVLIQVKQVRGSVSVDDEALNDVLAACDIYGQKLATSWRAVVVTNGLFHAAAVRGGAHVGVDLLSGERLVRRLAERHVGLGAMTICAANRCSTFEEGIRRAESYLRSGPS